MESEIIRIAANQGIFCLLFVVLLLYVLRENTIREKGYQQTIKENQQAIKENQKIIKQLSEKFCIADEIKHAVEDIRLKLAETQRRGLV